MSIAGEPKIIKNLRSGDLLVQCAKESHEKNVLQGRSNVFVIVMAIGEGSRVNVSLRTKQTNQRDQGSALVGAQGARPLHFINCQFRGIPLIFVSFTIQHTD